MARPEHLAKRFVGRLVLRVFVPEQPSLEGPRDVRQFIVRDRMGLLGPTRQPSRNDSRQFGADQQLSVEEWRGCSMPPGAQIQARRWPA